MNSHDVQYKNLIFDVMQAPEIQARNAKTRELFGYFLKFDMEQGFPLFTGRQLYPKGVWGELAAFIQGATNISTFKEYGCNYWDQWAKSDGSLGPVYGAQWKYGFGVNQLKELIQNIKDNPFSRRHVVTAWNPADMSKMSLPPCHYAFQVNITKDHRLDLLVTMRSLDVMVGFPSDVILYATLLHILAEYIGYKPGHLSFSIGSAHIYEAHYAQAEEYLSRAPLAPCKFTWVGEDVLTFHPDDCKIEGYNHHPKMQLELYL